MEQFEEKLHEDLHQFLLSMKEVDERLPECPDVEGKWEEIAKAYLPDGIREFQEYPSASLGWMMYVGMAVARYWDSEWEIYSKPMPDVGQGMPSSCSFSRRVWHKMHGLPAIGTAGAVPFRCVLWQ